MADPARHDPMLPQPFRIVERRSETHDTFTWSLAPVGDPEAPFRYAPGQFNMLYAFGTGEVPISISGDAEHPHELVHTIRMVGNVTRRMAELQAGDVIGVRGPFGEPWPVARAAGQDLVIIAGGIGLAPLRPVLYHALKNRGQYGRVVLLYGARNPREMIYVEELEAWRARFDMEIEVTVDAAGRDWRGAVGVVTTLIPWARFDPTHTTAMLCGPEIMMRFCARALLDRGVDPGDIFVSMERNMKCAIALCGHCQWGPHFVCKDGPVFAWGDVQHLFSHREI